MPRPRLGAEPLKATEKAARRRAKIKRMEEALQAIRTVRSAAEARRLAEEALKPEPPPVSD